MAKKYGRRKKLNKGIIESITTAIANGVSMISSAKYAGVSESVLYHWRKVGEDVRDRIDASEDPVELTAYESLCLQFLRDLEEAQAEARVRWTLVVNEAAKIDPSWAFRMLQIYDKQFQPQPPEIDVKHSGVIEIKYVNDWRDIEDGD